MMEVPTVLFVLMLLGLGAGMLAFAWIADTESAKEVEAERRAAARALLKARSYEVPHE